jgi:hypothetical protein
MSIWRYIASLRFSKTVMNTTPRLDVPAALQAGTRLRHHKGGLYEVTGACLIEATLETGILYRPLQGDASHLLWMRPASAFFETVQTAQGEVSRFTPV